jgi:hypothetical protein
VTLPPGRAKLSDRWVVGIESLPVVEPALVGMLELLLTKTRDNYGKRMVDLMGEAAEKVYAALTAVGLDVLSRHGPG